MIRLAIAASALLAATPLAAQSVNQEELQARYDRALAAGYKSLFLCGAMTSDRTGLRRTERSVQEYELTGIYGALEPMVRELAYRIERGTDGRIDYVATDWADNMPPRVAEYRGKTGCALLPIGSALPGQEVPWDVRIDRVADPTVYPLTEKLVPRVHQAAEQAIGDIYGEGTRTTAVLVRQGDVTKGKAFAAGFDADSTQRTWSVAKSLAATLVGAAVQSGTADVSQSAGLGIDDSDPRRAITIDHALRMASGRYSDTPGNRTDPLYMGGTTVAESALDWPLLNPPGTVYRYANNDTLAAVQAIDGYLAENPPIALFGRLGMHSTKAEADWLGDYILSSQVWTSAADLARFGQLYLNDGMWRGTRILPEGWLEYVSTPSGPQPDNGFGYGAGFWLFNDHDGVPADTIAAMGNRGQYVVIIPSMNAVIVRRGEDPAGSRFDIAAFTKDVIESLEK